MNRTDSPLDIGRLLDDGRWGGYQRWLVFLTALTVVFDGIDNQLLGVVIPTLMREWGVPRGAFAPIVSLGYLGMMTGGVLGGLAGDRFGRRTALLGSVALFGVTTLAAAAAGSPAQLAWLRLMAGLGLGAAMPNAAALAAELVPLRKRPIAVTVTIVCVPVGATIAGLLGIQALPAFGWRWLFAIGGVVPMVAAVLFMRLLPESPRYLARHPERWEELARILRRMGHTVDASHGFVDPGERSVVKASIAALFHPEYRRDTLALWGAFFSCLLAVYSGFSWLTSLLTAAGFGPGTANTGITGVQPGWRGWRPGRRRGDHAVRLQGRDAHDDGRRHRVRAGVEHDVDGPGRRAAHHRDAGGHRRADQRRADDDVRTGGVRLSGRRARDRCRQRGGVRPDPARLSAATPGSWAIGYHGSASFFGLIAVAMCSTFVALALVRRHIPASGNGGVRL